MADLTGRTVAGYPIVRVLGTGAYTTTYVGQTSDAEAGIAIKVLRDEFCMDRSFNAAFLRGAGEAGGVSHPNLAVVYGSGTDAVAGAYMLMEVVGGKTLVHTVAAGVHITWRDALTVLRQAAAAVGALAEAKMVHGDMRPSHIFLTLDQDVKISGACTSRYLPRPMSEILPVATLGYLPPEILEGDQPSLESDLYGLGACIYFLMVGRPPFVGADRQEVMDMVLTQMPQPLADHVEHLPEAVEELIVGRLLAKEPHKRYGSVADLDADIARLMDGQPLAPIPERAPALRKQVQRSATAKPRFKTGSEVLRSLAAIPRDVGSRETAGIGDSAESHIAAEEAKGDELYKKGQLPLAIVAWKEACRKQPDNATLKQKLSAAERELRQEAFRTAVETARGLMERRRFEEAAAQWAAARDLAENETQLAEAKRLYQVCLERGELQTRMRKLAFWAAAAVAIALAAGAAVWIARKHRAEREKAVEEAKEESAPLAPLPSGRKTRPSEKPALPPNKKDGADVGAAKNATVSETEAGKPATGEAAAKQSKAREEALPETPADARRSAAADPVAANSAAVQPTRSPPTLQTAPKDTGRAAAASEPPAETAAPEKPTVAEPGTAGLIPSHEPRAVEIEGIASLRLPPEFEEADPVRDMLLHMTIRMGAGAAGAPQAEMFAWKEPLPADKCAAELSKRDLAWNKEKKLDQLFYPVDRKWRVREMFFRSETGGGEQRETAVYVCELPGGSSLVFQFSVPKGKLEEMKPKFREIVRSLTYTSKK